MLFNLLLVFSSVYIVTQFAPAAAGSGIPEIKGYLNGKLQFYCPFSMSLANEPISDVGETPNVNLNVQELIHMVFFFSEP